MEVRELLDSYEFPGDDIPIVKGSALAAVEDRDAAIGRDSIMELMAAVDDYIPTQIVQRSSVPAANRRRVLDFRPWYGCYRSC